MIGLEIRPILHSANEQTSRCENYLKRYSSNNAKTIKE